MLDLNKRQREKLAKRKKVINLLKIRKRKHKELVEESGIGERTIDRILAELDALGLVKKEEEKGKRKPFGYWRWYIYIKKYTPKEYDVAIKHSKELMLGFQPFLETNPNPLLSYRSRPHPQSLETSPIRNDLIKLRIESYRLSVYAEEHLQTGYPEVYQNLIDFRQLFLKVQQMKPNVRVCTENMKGERRLVLSRDLKGVILEFGGHPLFFNEEDKKFYYNFVETEKSMLEKYQKLAAGIHRIRMSVEHGWNPLEGRCRICPNIIIKKEALKVG